MSYPGFTQYPISSGTPDSLLNSGSGSSSPAQQTTQAAQNPGVTTLECDLQPPQPQCALTSYPSEAILATASATYVNPLTTTRYPNDVFQNNVRASAETVVASPIDTTSNLHHHHHHQATFYPTISTAYMKDSDAWRSIPQTPSYYYDPTFPYGYSGLEFSPARRKNVTRDSTTTLKAWLNEHRKNPYPTKGEKIMLAIITKMTLTQVSTWFANARRRLKKENKMTWEPRNKTDLDRYEDSADEEDTEKCNENKTTDQRSQHNADNAVEGSERRDPREREYQVSGCEASFHRSYNHHQIPQSTSPELTTSPKPKIWSLADTATSKQQLMPDALGSTWFSAEPPVNTCVTYPNRSAPPMHVDKTSSAFSFGYVGGAPEPTLAIRPPSPRHQSPTSSSNMAAADLYSSTNLYNPVSAAPAASTPHLRLF